MRIVLLGIAIGLLCGGCRSRMDPSIDLLESELRWMEDQLYLLDDQLQEKCAQLASSHRENLTLRQELGRTSSQRNSAGLAQSPTTPRSSSPGRQNENQRAKPPFMPKKLPEQRSPAPNIVPHQNQEEPQEPDQIPAEDELMPPNIELGSPVDPSATNQHESEPLPHRQASFLHELPRLPETPVAATSDDVRVERIILNRRLTGGYDFDEQAGHEGLYLVVEPQDDQGAYLPNPAPLEVTVLDPKRTDTSSRVARWDFTAAETAAHMRQSLVGKGIHLQLPWPHQPPTHEELEVLATYHTTDGRALEAKQVIRVRILTSMPLPTISSG
ncbi:MAG: hypothetical protein O2931_03280, partial [Planctomycetota bacterium]|nr:hypothetical protein [Planctomycetota bacterium]